MSESNRRELLHNELQHARKHRPDSIQYIAKLEAELAAAGGPPPAPAQEKRKDGDARTGA